MARNIGRNGTFAITVSAALVEFGEVTGISSNLDRSLVDGTSFDDDGWETRFEGHRQLTGSVTMQYDPADAAQAAVFALVDGTSLVAIACRFRPQGAGSTLPNYAFNAFLTSENIDAQLRELGTITVNFESSGAVVKTAQT